MIEEEHHILFCKTEGYRKALKKIESKKYSKKNFSGFVIFIVEPLIKVDLDDYLSLALSTKAGLLRIRKVQFKNREEFYKIKDTIKPEEYKGVWGKFIVEL